MLEDAELLRRYVADRSEAAFAELVRRHLNLVYSAAWRRVGGDAHLAEDVAQKVFAALARQATALSSQVVLAGWLYTAARYSATQVVRAECRRRRREQEAYNMNDRFANSTPDPDWDQLRPLLDEMMDRLNARDREALLLRFFEGRRFAELGEKLNLSEEAARKRVERALEKLRTLLGERGVSSTGAAMAAMLANQSVFAAPPGLVATVTSSALASGSAVVPPLLAFLQFMSTSKIVAGIGGLLLILALGTATYEMRAHRLAESTLGVAKQDYDGLIMRQRESRQRVGAAEQKMAEVEKAIEAAQAAQAAEAQRTTTRAQAAAASALDPVAAGDAFMARHPEVKNAVNDYARARANFRFGEFFKSLGLTPAEIEQALTLMSEGYGMGASSADGKSLSLRSGQRGAGGGNEDKGKRLAGLLGEQRMQKFWDFSRASEARETVVAVAGALYFTDRPLTPEQSDQLVQIMVANRNKQRGRASEYDWDKVMAKAESVLAPSQLTVLAGMQADDRFDVALNTPPAPKPPSSNGQPGK